MMSNFFSEQTLKRDAMNFAPNSRTWIYLSSREFLDREVNEINLILNDFCVNWAAHGNNLKASGTLLHNRFIVLVVDESQAGASGCSIDTSVHFIQELEKKYETEFFNRLLFAYRNADLIDVSTLSDLESLVRNGTINDSTIIFNTAISSKIDFDNNFEKMLKKSWLMKRVEKLLQSIN
jgi:hypothetical protein